MATVETYGRAQAMPAPAALIELVERFRANRESYRSGGYKEAQLREEFVNPLFAALGWDVANAAGYAEAYKDVVHEDAIKIGGATKAPDYCFRIGGARKFFVEVKKPSVAIRNEPAPAFQLRRYAWSAKLPLSILTDFEELAVYDCRTRPHRTDKASTGRTIYFTFEELPAKWDELAAVFSREAVLKGSFDKYAEGGRGKKGTAEVDEAFLEEIEAWRSELAKDIARRNPKLSVRDLNFAVGRTIDRIVFLRIAEDRGIESYGALLALVNGEHVYKRLVELFGRADERFNSGLFHFREEPGQHSPPDELTTALKIDDEPLKRIVRGLYYPSPYEFAVIPADILGQVYEQFLGKVIRLTAGHQARVEDKPEVKKAGGVYYTPTYIVDYIVRNTVGKLLEGKTPKQVAGDKRRPPLRVLDPACGSGSFLIGAYQHLLDWYRDRYVEEGPEKRRKELYQGFGGQWRLATAERKRILLDHIYGVDIDQQAVEVTKLSLLLKVLEGESGESLRKQLFIFHERALPDLGANIKCGNSLIGPDFFDGQQGNLFGDEEERRRVNAFDWRAEFPEVFHHQDTKGTKNDGGFDCVIGNPPYVRPHNLAKESKEYFWKHYRTFVKKSDLYCCFIEKAISLLGPVGAFGFIVSNGWLRLDSFENLRQLLLKQTSVRTLIDFAGKVFPRASVSTCILLLDKPQRVSNRINVISCPAGSDLTKVRFKTISQALFQETYKSIFDLSSDDQLYSIKQKMKKMGVALGDLFDVSFGLKTGDDSKFLTYSRKNERYKRLLRGEDVHRYSSAFKGEYVWYVPDKMREHRKTARPGTADRFEQPKVLIRDTGAGLGGTYDSENYYVKDVLVLSRQDKDARVLQFLLGMINSKLMRLFYETSFPTLHVQRDELASLPIRPIDFSNPADQAAHDRMVSLVERMLDLHRKLAAAKSPDEKTRLDREIKSTDAEIDRLVYELYGLTEEEIRIVEGTGNA